MFHWSNGIIYDAAAAAYAVAAVMVSIWSDLCMMGEVYEYNF
jgi:hypothetical protein